MLRLILAYTCAMLAVSSGAAPSAAKEKILFVVGPSNHGPGTHEVEAGTRLLNACVNQATTGLRFDTEISQGWPTTSASFDRARTIVFMGDGFPPYQFANANDVFAQLAKLIEKGCSVVCIHYATSVKDEESKVVSAEVKSTLYQWLGGFGHFLPKNALPGTQARVLDLDVTPTASRHPIVRGVKPFTLRDEPYFPIVFDPAQTPGKTTFLATAQLPPEAPKTETVAWCVERVNGSRSVSILFPHFYENWQNEDLRKLVLNGVLWSAGVEIPADGISSTLPALETFEPKSVKPIKRAP